MQHTSSKTLYKYWDTVRDGRVAPNRFEIEPAKLSGILPDAFILESPDIETFRFRLAGTRICTMFGHELQGGNLLDYVSGDDREAIHTLLHNVAKDGAGALAHLEYRKSDQEIARFELLALPLFHNGKVINRMLGCLAPLNLPHWAGTVDIRQLELVDFEMIWPRVHVPDSVAKVETPVFNKTAQKSFGGLRNHLRVLEGGLSSKPEPAGG